MVVCAALVWPSTQGHHGLGRAGSNVVSARKALVEHYSGCTKHFLMNGRMHTFSSFPSSFPDRCKPCTGFLWHGRCVCVRAKLLCLIGSSKAEGFRYGCFVLGDGYIGLALTLIDLECTASPFIEDHDRTRRMIVSLLLVLVGMVCSAAKTSGRCFLEHRRLPNQNTSNSHVFPSLQSR
ncbi:hypothetical protein BDU57DRAFT_118556 [Ampelomyces quisqualis]|uniref:Uncharacterized protein n=1 Tax=Ampelomyces quisqualis TaxID=50730 RepID=A0A6A5QV66_AMPQU|nr:hypothetical protein BDU57DRAFT_118556 [Ampelomyces quisqualis]